METSLGYRRTDGGEPHRIRRRAILAAHPEIAELFGWDRWPKYRMAAVLAIQLAIAWGVEAFARSASATAAAAVLAVLAYVVGAVLNHYGGVVIHEAAHDLCAPTKT